MSKKHFQKITCPSCKKVADFEFWEAMNMSLEPALKERILNYDVFRFMCPFCGEEQFVHYSFLYHDPDNKTMLFYVQSQEEKEKVLELFAKDKALMDAQGYRRRIVIGIDALTEKIRMFDAGLDDRIMEVFKIFLYSQVQDQLLAMTEGEEIDYVMFDQHVDGKEYLVFVKEGQSLAELPFDHTTYVSLAEKMKGDIEASTINDAIVDNQWAYTFLQQHAGDA